MAIEPLSNAANIQAWDWETDSVHMVAQALIKKVKYDFTQRIKPYIKQDPRFPHLPAPRMLYQATVGVGKTEALIKVVLLALEHKMRIAVRTPTTDLAKAICDRIEAVCPGAAAVWLGREQADPSDSSRKMCPRHDIVKATLAVGGDPYDACGSRKHGYCKYHPSSANDSRPCAYKPQDLGEKSVVIFAGDSMLGLVPRRGMKKNKKWSPYNFPNEDNIADLLDAPIRKKIKRSTSLGGEQDFDLLILDETDALAFLDGFNDTIGFNPKKAVGLTYSKDEAAQDILNGFAIAVVEQIKSTNSGYLSPLQFTWDSSNQDKSDIETFEVVREFAYKNMPKPRGKTDFYKMSIAEILKINQDISKRRAALKAIIKICEAMILGVRNQLKDLSHLKISTDDAGDKVLEIRRLKDIQLAYRTLPMIIFDATSRPSLLELIIPGLEMAFNKTVRDGVGVLRYQLRDKSLSYQTLDDDKWSARLLLLAELLKQPDKEIGLIVPKKVENAIVGIAHTNVLINHFGALKGGNSFEKVSALIVASRPAVHFAHTEDMATVLTGKNVQKLPQSGDNFTWYPKKTTFIKHRDGKTGWPVQNDCHPDPVVEQVRCSITNDNLEQALGRSRNIRRTKQTPLIEYILTNVATGRLIDGVFDLSELKAVTGWVGVLLHAGVWICDGKGMGILLPILRGVLSQRRNPLYRLLIGNSAFETPDQASKWRKDQLKDNPEVARLVASVDKALAAAENHVLLLYSEFSLNKFKPVRAKVRGARYFAKVYVRVQNDQTASEALTEILGSRSSDVEIEY